MIRPYKNALAYINEIESTANPDHEALWEKHLIAPYWDEIAQWAPFDCSFMKPAPIKDVLKLKEQLPILDSIDFNTLSDEFTRAMRALPKDDDDPITVAIYPIDDDNNVVKERQNGVLGACVFGNIIININPLAKDFTKWIPYVFAHEHHHCVLGYHWITQKGGLDDRFLAYLLNEGQADAFAKHLYPHLNPSWLQPLPTEALKDAWKKLKSVLDSTDRDIHAQYMFGSEALHLPWCIGYYFGHLIVHRFMEIHPDVDFRELLALPPDDIYRMSGLVDILF